MRAGHPHGRGSSTVSADLARWCAGDGEKTLGAVGIALEIVIGAAAIRGIGELI